MAHHLVSGFNMYVSRILYAESGPDQDRRTDCLAASKSVPGYDGCLLIHIIGGTFIGSWNRRSGSDHRMCFRGRNLEMKSNPILLAEAVIYREYPYCNCGSRRNKRYERAKDSGKKSITPV